MSSAATFYPPCPRNVPEDLTDPSPDYRRQVKMVRASLIAFVWIYLGLLIVSGCGIALAILLLVAAPHFFTFLLLPAAGMLFLFFIKGLFKRQKQDRSHLIEVTEEEHPRLFAFIRELVEDTGAPCPKAVYVSPEVNWPGRIHSPCRRSATWPPVCGWASISSPILS